MSRWRRLTAWITTSARRIVAAVRVTGAAVAQATSAAAQRHRDRVGTDRAYGRTVAAAVSEVISTLVPRPWLATTLAVALAGLLGSHDDEPDDRYEPDYRTPYRTSKPSSPAPAGSLWDRLGT